MANMGEALGVGMLVVVPVVVVVSCLYLLVACGLALFGTRDKRRQRLRRATGIAVAVIIGTVGIWILGDYMRLAALRDTAHSCESKAAGDGEYIATRCRLNGRHGSLRIYDSQTKRLLAERTYRCDDGDPDLVTGLSLAFDACADDDGAIRLPPSLLDQVRAALP